MQPIRLNFPQIVSEQCTSSTKEVHTRVATYQTLLNNQEITVDYHPQTGLSASVNQLDREGNVVQTRASLPFCGIPKEMSLVTNIDLIRKFFSHTHLCPESDGEGNVNRVSVHISLKGGVKSKIPPIDGFALGSIIPGEWLEKMEQYSSLMAQISNLQKEIESAWKELDVLETKIIESHTKKEAILGNTENPRRQFEADKIELFTTVWEAQKAFIEANVGALRDQMQANVRTLATLQFPSFAGFQQGLKSPIDDRRSRFEIQKRGFETIDYSSRYFDMREDSSEIHDRVEQSSSSGSLSIGGGWGPWSANVTASRTSGISERVSDIQKQGLSRGVLVVNAHLTTRNVKCYTEIKYDQAALEDILEVMKSGEAESLKRFGITSRQKGSNTVYEIYILAEAVLGGAFTAVVTYLDERKMKRDAKIAEKEARMGIDINLGGGLGLFSGKIGGGYASQSAERSEDDVVKSATSTTVEIEFYAQGAIPGFERTTVEKEAFSQDSLNPSKFEVSEKDKSDLKSLASCSAEERMEILEEQRLKAELAQVAAVNAVRAIQSQKYSQSIHTSASVMQAFDNYVERIRNDENCGVPVGFNYIILTQNRIEKILANMKKVKPDQPPKEKEGERPHTDDSHQPSRAARSTD